ncbi:hypothetical protein [Streptomyces spororaveus]|uniref:hypothetical protein n=1 Tax=Streptomyces spororaveus TaxID=284039 RepID=UPI00378B0099
MAAQYRDQVPAGRRDFAGNASIEGGGEHVGELACVVGEGGGGVPGGLGGVVAAGELLGEGGERFPGQGGEELLGVELFGEAAQHGGGGGAREVGADVDRALVRKGDDQAMSVEGSEGDDVGCAVHGGGTPWPG